MRVFLVKAMQIQLKQCKILYGILRSVFVCACVKVTQLCLTLCNPMDCSLPGASVRGILQARILEWVAIPFSGGSSQPRDWTQVSHIAGEFFTSLGYYGYLLFFSLWSVLSLGFWSVVLPVGMPGNFYWVMNIVCKNIEVQMMLFLPEKVYLSLH